MGWLSVESLQLPRTIQRRERVPVIPKIIFATERCDGAKWLRHNYQTVNQLLDRVGAVLLRGFDISAEIHFQNVVDIMCDNPINYIYRSTPRTELGRGIYTATEYPPGLPIPLHNENSYQRDWPMVIMFCCLRPADSGAGQTPLGDSVKITSRINPNILNLFREKRVAYIRNYHDDIDLPWQTVFQTESKEEVDRYCRAHDITATWMPNGTLRTRQVCHAFATHPTLGQSIWFNQAHLFHPSALDEKTRSLLSEMFSEEEFPRNVTFGDGSRIDESMLSDIRSAFEEEKVMFSWSKGDILILDNMRVAHGRSPYRGPRRVLTAMGRPYSSLQDTNRPD